MATSYLPSGFDRATGESGFPGTPNPSGQPYINGQSGAELENIEELPDSPVIERAEQATIQHKFQMSLDNATTFLITLGRGTILEDSYGNVTRVLSSKMQPVRGGYASLEVTAEGINFDSPPDEFQVVPESLGIHIIKHPRYIYALVNQPGDSDATKTAKQFAVNNILLYMQTPTLPQQFGYLQSLAVDPLYSDEKNLAYAAAQEIITKLWLQEDSPYVIGYRVTWSQYYFRPPFLNPGGYTEDPILEGGLPAYFGSPDWDYSTSTIFDNIADDNPQCYADASGNPSISWMRQADEIDYQRTWFRITRTWIGAPVGNWDTQLYTADARPTVYTEYNYIKEVA